MLSFKMTTPCFENVLVNKLDKSARVSAAKRLHSVNCTHIHLRGSSPIFFLLSGTRKRA